jgi:hypothetical protein
VPLPASPGSATISAPPITLPAATKAPVIYVLDETADRSNCALAAHATMRKA